MLPPITIGLLMDLAEMAASKVPTERILAYSADVPHVRTLEYLVAIRQAPGEEHCRNYLGFYKSKRYLAQKFSFLGQSTLKWSNDPHSRHLACFLGVWLGVRGLGVGEEGPIIGEDLF